MLIRNAEPKDVPAILARYNQAVRETTAAWTSREETLDERLTWFEGRMKQDLPVLVAVDETDAVLGFASFGPFRPREGYRLTAEHSVYVDPAAQRRGIGRALLERLMEIAIAKNLHVLVGVIDGGNTPSPCTRNSASMSPDACRKPARSLATGWIWSSSPRFWDRCSRRKPRCGL
jgi:phosphinothricin acetyltransferase